MCSGSYQRACVHEHACKELVKTIPQSHWGVAVSADHLGTSGSQPRLEQTGAQPGLRSVSKDKTRESFLILALLTPICEAARVGRHCTRSTGGESARPQESYHPYYLRLPKTNMQINAAEEGRGPLCLLDTMGWGLGHLFCPSIAQDFKKEEDVLHSHGRYNRFL